MKPAEAYRWLLDNSRTTALYESMKALLHWDQRTCLPKEGHSHRSQQIAAMTALLYRRATDPQLGEMLEKVEGSDIPGKPLSGLHDRLFETKVSETLLTMTSAFALDGCAFPPLGLEGVSSCA